MIKEFKNSLHKFLSLPRIQKRIITIFIDFVMLFTACLLAFVLRLGEFWAPLLQYWQVCVIAPLITIPFMIHMGLYRAIIRYIGYQALWTCAQATTLSVIVWSLVLTLADFNLPRTVIIIYWFISLVAVSSTRIFGRWAICQLQPIGKRYKKHSAEQVVIYGAGANGRQLAMAMLQSQELQPVAFIDDDVSLHGMEINGLEVFPVTELPDLIRLYSAEAVLLAITTLSRQRRLAIVRKLENFSLRVLTLPGISDLAQGKIQISDVREIEVIDLLRREAMRPNNALLSTCITNKSVMVTGAGGSIGSELCRQISKLQPTRLILFELTEFALYSIENEISEFIKNSNLTIDLIPILGSVQNKSQLKAVMQRYQINTLYHAAAYKHVPLVEHNVIAGILNNVFGTWYTAEAAVAAGIENFVLVSTDKAVRPTNVMGATKRLAELILQGMSLRESDKNNSIRFSMVRFGNVLDSSGSVVPLFRKQIATGGPVTVTHPDITRYFMTIPEAASLIIQAGSIGDGGDVFVLDMGQPVKVVDIAREMIKLAGCSVKDVDNPNGDIEIIFTGLRHGEKLFEELFINGGFKYEVRNCTFVC